MSISKIRTENNILFTKDWQEKVIRGKYSCKKEFCYNFIFQFKEHEIILFSFPQALSEEFNLYDEIKESFVYLRY